MGTRMFRRVGSPEHPRLNRHVGGCSNFGPLPSGLVPFMIRELPKEPLSQKNLRMSSVICRP